MLVSFVCPYYVHCMLELLLNKFILVYKYVLLSCILIDFLLTVKAATLIFINGRTSAISSAKEGKSGPIYNLLKR